MLSRQSGLSGLSRVLAGGGLAVALAVGPVASASAVVKRLANRPQIR